MSSRLTRLADAHLSRDTLLQLAPGVRTGLDASGHALVDAPDGTIIDVGPLHTLST